MRSPTLLISVIFIAFSMLSIIRLWPRPLSATTESRSSPRAMTNPTKTSVSSSPRVSALLVTFEDVQLMCRLPVVGCSSCHHRHWFLVSKSFSGCPKLFLSLGNLGFHVYCISAIYLCLYSQQAIAFNLRCC